MTHRDTPTTRARNLGIDAGAFVAAFTASPTPMVLTDPRQPDNPIVWANDAFLGLTGYAWEELDGRNCRLLQGRDTDPRAVRRLNEAVRMGLPIEIELVNYRKDGSSFWNGMTVAPVRDATGEVVHFYAAQADMTGKHRHEVAMRDAQDELERRVSEQTADLRAALEQKTALLHEVDHRVKEQPPGHLLPDAAEGAAHAEGRGAGRAAGHGRAHRSPLDRTSDALLDRRRDAVRPAGIRRGFRV